MAVKPRQFQTAKSQNKTSCPICFLLNSASDSHCSDCKSRLHATHSASLQPPLALLITAIILYIPANFMPIMYTVYLGEKQANTIIGGVMSLWSQGSEPIALIIFIASVLVPIGKIIALSWLCYAVNQVGIGSYKLQHKLYRFTEFIGKWSMVDIFVVTVLVALIQMGNFMSVMPGEAAIAFALMVIVTMLAANAFDPRLIWQQHNLSSKE